MQDDSTAMTPNGEMYYESNIYSADFTKYALRGDTNTIGGSHLFIHEMMHVWQYQKGYSVKLHGLLLWAADYTYYLDASSLVSYSMEQQASIIADYWLLKSYGLGSAPSVVNYKGDVNESSGNILLKFEHVLGLFPRCVI